MRSLYLLNHDPQMEFIQLSIQLLRSVILLDIFPPKYLSSYNDGCTLLSQWLYLILLNSLLVDVRNQQEGREACYCCLGYSASCVESALISDSRLEFFFFWNIIFMMDLTIGKSLRCSHRNVIYVLIAIVFDYLCFPRLLNAAPKQSL